MTTPVAYAIYDSLTKYGPNFEALPDLASSWDLSADGKSITWHLRPGLKFHDGTAVDTQAVKFNIDSMIDGYPDIVTQARSVVSEAIASTVVDDDLTITFNLKRPFRPLLTYMGGQETMLMSPASVRKDGANVAEKPVAAGPFKLKSWIFQGEIVLERFDDYWDEGKPYVDGIRYVPSDDASVTSAMIRTGEVDFATVRGSDVRSIEANANLKIIRHEGGRYAGMHLDQTKEPFSKLAFRQAMAYAMDRPNFLEVFFEGAGRPAYAPIAIGWAAYPLDIQTYKFDPQMARAKLAEAGFPNGTSIDIDCSASATAQLGGEIVQAFLADVGIDVNIVTHESRGFYQRNIHEDLYKFTCPGTRGPQADPHNLLQILFHSTGTANPTEYANPAVDKLIDDAATVYDQAKAVQMYRQVMDMVVNDLPYIYLAYKDEFAAMNKKVNGFVWIPDTDLRLQDIWMEQ